MLEALAGPPQRTHGERWASSCVPTANLGTRALWGGIFAEPTALQGHGNIDCRSGPRCREIARRPGLPDWPVTPWSPRALVTGASG